MMIMSVSSRYNFVSQSLLWPSELSLNSSETVLTQRYKIHGSFYGTWHCSSVSRKLLESWKKSSNIFIITVYYNRWTVIVDIHVKCLINLISPVETSSRIILLYFRDNGCDKNNCLNTNYIKIWASSRQCR